MASSGLVSSGFEDVSEEPSPPSHGTGSAVSPRPEPSTSDSRESVVSSRMARISHHRDFLKELQSFSYNLGDPIPTQHTIQPGISGVAGVLEGTPIHFQHL